MNKKKSIMVNGKNINVEEIDEISDE